MSAVSDAVGGATRPGALVLEWTDPAFTAGHWVPDLVDRAGGESLLGASGQRSQGVEWSEIQNAPADVVVVSPCGFGIDGAAALAEQVAGGGLVPPSADVWAVDADAYVVRPGPRVVDGVEMLASIFHPTLVGEPDPGMARRIR